MACDVTITEVKVTPIAFRDGPLLNAAGIHEPWALRAIVEIESSDGRVGISETYGDEPMLNILEQARPLLIGLSPFALNEMEDRVRATVKAVPGAIEFELAPGSHAAKNVPKVISTFEVGMLDLQGQIVNAPVVDLLGGAVRPAVPTAPTFFSSTDAPQLVPGFLGIRVPEVPTQLAHQLGQQPLSVALGLAVVAQPGDDLLEVAQQRHGLVDELM